VCKAGTSDANAIPRDVINDRKLIDGRWVRWDDERAADAYARGWWVRGTLADSLRDAARRTPRRLVLIDGDCRLDCQTLYAQASTLAQALLARMPVGGVVSIMLPNWHEAAVIYSAATLAGMVVNPLLPSLRERELRVLLADVGTRMIFVPEAWRGHDLASMAAAVAGRMDIGVVAVRGESTEHTRYANLLAYPAEPHDLPAVDPDGVRLILYTSGTAGRPKGVLHTHNSVHALIRQIGDHWLVTDGDRFLVPSPTAHIGGSIYAFECPLLLGTTAILMDHWSADDAVHLMQTEGCTHLAGATPFLDQLLAAARRYGSRLPDLKMFICGGAAVSPSLIRSATAYFDRAVITRVYGCTEVPVITVGAPEVDDADHAADTDGRSGLAEVKIADDDTAAARAGELLARGPQMFAGYLDPEDDRDSFDAAGFFRTGDLGRWVDNDYLVVTGRVKDVIIRSGENISPKEIEDALAGHPDIEEVAVVGLPDARTGERACAVVVPRSTPGPDVSALRSFLTAQGVARFKAPEQVAIWAALPRNDAGKVLKEAIKSVLTTEL
jgi:acyl-CoA synthetase (AMP-forming)/AMP-acid ligase II